MVSSIPNDLPTGQVTEVDIDLIDVCHLNPRRAGNAAFDELYESIRLNGLDNPIHISRRPDQTRYFVSGGGNTRLAVYRRLLDDTGDQRFARIPSIFHPYVGEIEVLKAHLRENSQRAPLIFIDEAIALANLRRMLEDELGSKINDVEFEKILLGTGFPRSRRELGRMAYAVRVLYPVIPTALEAGMGSRAVERLGRLNKAYLAWGLERKGATGQVEDIALIFANALKSHDAAVLDEGAVRATLDAQLAVLFNFPATSLRKVIDAFLQGGDKRIKAAVMKQSPAASTVPPSAVGLSVIAGEPDAPPEKPVVSEMDRLPTVEPDVEAEETGFAARTVAPDWLPAVEPDVELVVADMDPEPGLLRIRDFVSAIAETAGLQGQVRWDPAAPFGFLLSEPPTGGADPLVWGLLRTLSGQGCDHKLFDECQFPPVSLLRDCFKLADAILQRCIAR